MDIALLSIALSQGKVQQQASMSIMKKAMGTDQQGEALQQLMSSADTSAAQHAAQPHLGGNVDLIG